MNKEELRKDYIKFSKLNSIEDCIDLLDIFIEFLGNIIGKFKPYEINCLSESDKDASIINQMILTKLLCLKKIVEGITYKGNGFSLNKIIDPIPTTTLIRNIFETISVFNLIYKQPKNEEEKIIVYNLWVISGLKFRQRFEKHITLDDNKEKIKAEKKEIEDRIKEIKETSLYKNLDNNNQDIINKKIKKKDYKISFSDNIINNHSWQDMFNVMGLKQNLFEDMYTNFCLYAHPSQVSVFQYSQMYNPQEKAFLHIVKFNLKCCLSLVSIFIADYMNLFPATKNIFKEIEINKQIAIIILHEIFREERFPVDDALKYLE